jgi:hypothetical protein
MPDPKIAGRPPVDPPPPDPVLTRASVTFHTNDDDKDDDTLVEVEVRLSDQRTVVAKLSDYLGHFADNSNAGPFTLLMVKAPVHRSQLQTGSVSVWGGGHATFPPFGHGDTWRFNFVVDLFFDDGAHLLARANGVEMSLGAPAQSFGIE